MEKDLTRGGSLPPSASARGLRRPCLDGHAAHRMGCALRRALGARRPERGGGTRALCAHLSSAGHPLAASRQSMTSVDPSPFMAAFAASLHRSFRTKRSCGDRATRRWTVGRGGAFSQRKRAPMSPGVETRLPRRRADRPPECPVRVEHLAQACGRAAPRASGGGNRHQRTASSLSS